MIANAEPAEAVETTAVAVRSNGNNNNGNGIAIRHMDDDGPSRGGINSLAMFELIQNQAMVLAHSAFVPAHLVDEKNPQRTQANCFRVAEQATRWNMSVFTVADRSYVQRGKLGFEGKLIASLINTDPRVKGSLSYKFSGAGDDRTVEVSATLRNETEPRTITLSVAQAKTANDMWKRDPDQKLVYCGALKWARRHIPEIIDGILTDDDLEVIAQQDAPPADNRTPEEVAADEAAKKAETDRKMAEAAEKQKAAIRAQRLAGSGSVQPAAQQPTTTTATTATPAPELVNAATKARIVAAFKGSGATREQFAALLVKHGGAGTTELGKLTQPQALAMEGELLAMAPAEVGNARQEAAAATEKPVVEQTSPSPQAKSEATPAAATTAPAAITSTGPAIDAINLASLKKLIDETPRNVLPSHEIKAWLNARGISSFAQMSNADAVKLIGEIEGKIAKAAAGSAA